MNHAQRPENLIGYLPGPTGCLTRFANGFASPYHTLPTKVVGVYRDEAVEAGTARLNPAPAQTGRPAPRGIIAASF